MSTRDGRAIANGNLSTRNGGSPEEEVVAAADSTEDMAVDVTVETTEASNPVSTGLRDPGQRGRPVTDRFPGDGLDGSDEEIRSLLKP